MVLECRVSKVVEIGTHTQFIGEILDVKIDEKVLDAEEKPVLSKINPLAFDIVHSEYSCPGKIVGKAFSAEKYYFRVFADSPAQTPPMMSEITAMAGGSGDFVVGT